MGCTGFSKFDSIGTIELKFSRFDLFVVVSKLSYVLL